MIGKHESLFSLSIAEPAEEDLENVVAVVHFQAAAVLDSVVDLESVGYLGSVDGLQVGFSSKNLCMRPDALYNDNVKYPCRAILQCRKLMFCHFCENDFRRVVLGNRSNFLIHFINKQITLVLCDLHRHL